jgi:hypothetical protein
MPKLPRPATHIIPGRLTNEELTARDKYKELQRCIRSSWYLATEYLGYEFNEQAGVGLVERVHEPICKWYDRHQDEPRIGIWMARGRHKTTLIVTWIIRSILKNPAQSHRYWHAVNDLASEFLLEVVSHFKNNDRLRWLDPVGYDPKLDRRYNIFPTKQNTRWYKTSKGDASLRVGQASRFGAGTRSATIRAQGQTSEVTGAHISGEAWLDDVIAETTILNNETHKVADWYRRSVVPVVDSKKFRVVGTAWPGQHIYKQWMQSGRWRTLIVPGAISETDEDFKARLQGTEKKIHFLPDYKFTNPMHGRADEPGKTERLDARRQFMADEQEDMQGSFGPQIMMDDEPESDRYWTQGCENLCMLERDASGMPGALEGAGVFVVLSDPAPWKEGSWRSIGEKQRGDGTKDEWAIGVLRVRVRGDLWEAILIDGDASMTWGESQGCDVACSFMKRWRTNIFISEDPSSWHERMIEAARRNAVALRREKDGGPFKFEIYNKAQRKTTSFSALCDLARDGRFYICRETCSKAFLDGDGEHTGFLTQARKARKVKEGQWNLRFDDRIDMVSRIMDPVIRSLSPRHDKGGVSESWWGQMMRLRQQSPTTWGVRHIRA